MEIANGKEHFEDLGIDGEGIKEDCREIETWVQRGFMYIMIRSSNALCD